MYRPTLDKRDKGGALAAVIAIHAALAFAFLHLGGKVGLPDVEEALEVFNLREIKPPLPPPPPPPPAQRQKPQPKAKEGGSAPKNIRSEATAVVAPKPRIELPVPPRIAVSETPREGAAPTQGASDVRGPGTGAGGVGTGTGSGGSGSGSGGGGDGGIATRAQLLTRSLSSRDFPSEFRSRLSRGQAPFVIFTVLPNGRVANCKIYQSSGDPALDATTCALVSSRFVYRPAFNRRGEPVSSQMAYRQAN